jgi:hypothetical protein
MKQKLFMETTRVPAERTASEILGLLVQAGAGQVAMEYKDKKIAALRFGLEVARRGTVIFVLPVRVEPIFKLINGRRAYEYDRRLKANQDRAQSEMVAWRQLFRWVQAQVALIQTGMVEAGEVFFPYMQDENGQTVWERVIAGNQQLALPPASEDSNVKEFKR